MNVQFSLSANISSNYAAAPAIVQVTPQAKPASQQQSQPQSDSSASSSQQTDVATLMNSGVPLSQLEKKSGTLTTAEQQFIKKIESAVKALQGPQTTLNISIHEKTHEIMVKVLNKDTGEVLREVPPEKTLDLVAKMMELAGIMIDERV